MKRNIFFTILLFILGCLKTFAHIDIVYPVSNNVTTNAQSIFFIGNTTAGADFTINSQNVQLWENNFFVHVVPLNYGDNPIKMVSVKDGIKEEKIYTVIRSEPGNGTNSSAAPVFMQNNPATVLYTKTVKENATIREKPSTSAARVVDLPQNVTLYLSGKQGDYYKIEETGDTQYWIHKSNVQEPVNTDKRNPALLETINEYTDDNYDYIRFSLNYPVLYNLNQTGNKIKLTLYGIKSTDETGKETPNYTYIHNHKRALMGYDAYYDQNSLILRIAKTPKITHHQHSLEGITIFIDPGHGGSEKGSVGPTRICEKDINLEISKYLVKYLKKEGANAIISREEDVKTGLYDRVKTAKENNALISISIHNNALPNGKDPYVQHGTEVHYYNENAKLLAQIIQDDLVQNLNFNDNGIHKSSFALNRSTNPVSVLVECAYMINPEEYIRLKNPATQKKIAQSVKNSIKKYLISVQN